MQVTHAVSRATAPLATLWGWTASALVPMQARDEEWESGLIVLKGGDLQGEIDELRFRYGNMCVERYPLEPLLDNPYFRDKELLHVKHQD